MTLDTQLPADLPAPVDDGACDHLEGMLLPDIKLGTSDGTEVNFSKLHGLLVIYVYPMSGPTNDNLPDNWDAIPGARGCTPQSCSFRDHFRELSDLDASVYGLSTQSTDYLAAEVSRLHLPYPLVSDERLFFVHALRLPVFDVLVEGTIVTKRVTLICRDGKIAKVFYPVFPPDKNADEVVGWLKTNRRNAGSSG